MQATPEASSASQSPPNLELAKGHRLRNAILDKDTGQRYVNPFRAHRFDLGRYSVGVELYFELMRDLIVILSLMALLKVPQMITSHVGSMLRNLRGIYATMLGNWGQDPLVTESDPFFVAEALRRREVISGSHMDIKEIGLAFSTLDFVTVSIMVVFILYFIRFKVVSIVEENDKENHTLSDHTIQVTHMPRQIEDQEAYEDHLRDHFVDLVNNLRETKRRDYISNSGHLLTMGRLRHTKAEIKDDPSIIAEIVIVKDHRRSIAHYMRLHELYKERDELEMIENQGLLIEKVAYRTNRRLRIIRFKIAKYEQEIASNDSNLDTTDSLLNRDVIASFVSFRHTSDTKLVLEAYAPVSGRFSRRSQSKSLRFQNTPLKVVRAPEPDDILWENLDVSNSVRIRRILQITLILGVILTLAFFGLGALESLGEHESPQAIPTAKYYRFDLKTDEANEELLGICDLEFYRDFGCDSDQIINDDKFIIQSEDLHQKGDINSWTNTCTEPNTAWETDWSKSGGALWVSFNKPQEVRCLKFKRSLFTNRDVKLRKFAFNLKLWGCDSVDLCTLIQDVQVHNGEAKLNLFNWATIHTDDCRNTDIKNYSPELIEVLSQEVKQEEKKGRHLSETETKSEAANAEWYLSCICEEKDLKKTEGCSHLRKQELHSTIKHWGMSAAVHLINSVLKKVVRVTVWHWTYPVSHTQRFSLSMMALFWAEFINSGLLLFLITSKVFPASHLPWENSVSGDNGDIGARWYPTTGKALLTFSFIFIFYPHVLQLIAIPIRRFIARRKAGMASSQEQMNEVYEDEEFKLDSRLATTVSLACVAMTYSAPIPFVLVCASLGLFLAYWCDKMQYLWNSCRPSAMSYEVIVTAVTLLQVGVIGHCLIAVATYGHPLVTPSDMINSNPNKFLSKLIASSDSSLTYAADTGHALFESGWFSARAQTYILSKVAAPISIPMIIIGGLFIVAIIISVCMIFVFPAQRLTIIQTILSIIMPQPRAIIHMDTHEDLKSDFIDRGHVASYDWADNPKYTHAARIVDHLDRLKTINNTSLEADAVNDLGNNLRNDLGNNLRNNLRNVSRNDSRDDSRNDLRNVSRTPDAVKNDAHTPETAANITSYQTSRGSEGLD